jgi:hypothetical protein
MPHIQDHSPSQNGPEYAFGGRVVVPLREKTLPSVVIGLDRALRRFGGVPTYAFYEYVPGHIFRLLFPSALCVGG